MADLYETVEDGHLKLTEREETLIAGIILKDNSLSKKMVRSFSKKFQNLIQIEALRLKEVGKNQLQISDDQS